MRSLLGILVVGLSFSGCATPGESVDAAARLDERGELELAQGRLDDAEATFRRALDLDPGFVSAHDGIAMVRFHRGDDAGGVAALQAGLRVADTGERHRFARVRLLENLAWAQLLRGDEAAALATIGASVEAQGLADHAATAAVEHLGRARLFVHLARWRDALAETEAAHCAGAPDYAAAVAFAIEASVFAASDDPRRAESALAEARARMPDHPAITIASLDIALARNDWLAVTTLLPTIDEADPYAGEAARDRIARRLLTTGRAAEAQPWLEQLQHCWLRSVGSAHLRREAERTSASEKGT